MQEIVPLETESIQIPQAKTFVADGSVRALGVLMFFGICWITAWLDYTCQFVIMVSTCSYYFNSSPEQEGDADIKLGFVSSFYHFGSIAFGSFFIAMIRMVAVLVGYAAMLVTRAQAHFATMTCCHQIWDESTLSYMAATGDPFLSSAW